MHARTHSLTCVRETQGEPCVALLKVEPETEFTFAGVGSHARRPLFVNRLRISFSKLERGTTATAEVDGRVPAFSIPQSSAAYLGL